MKVRMDSKSENEGLARMVAASFLVQFNPTVEEMEDVKMAISEGVTNAIIHGYNEQEGEIELDFSRAGEMVTIIIKDQGVGIDDIHMAMQPMFTTKPEMERSGMGFTFMEAFMDEVFVESEKGGGTKVTLRKRFGAHNHQV